MASGAMRVLVAAFGDAGHAFPAIALARALAGRGHEVTVETWERWREAAEGEGLAFTAAEEYRTFPPPPPGSDGPSAADAAKAMLPMLREMRPDVVVADILTQAPALAAEVAGLPRATLVPHVYPVSEPGMPFFAFGAAPPRTVAGRALWRAASPLLVKGLERGREELNASRRALGLAPVERFHGGLSEELVLVGTFPQLEYPREWPAHVKVVGPMEFELPADEVAVPEGEGRWWWSRLRLRRTRRGGWCGRRSRGWRRSRCGCWRRRTGRASRCRRRRRTRWWSSGSATRRRWRRPTWSSATAVTGRWRGRWRRAARCSAARRSAT